MAVAFLILCCIH